MAKIWWSKVGGLMLCGVLGALLAASGCKLGLDGSGGSGGGVGGGEAALADVDPLERARAEALAYTLTGLVNQSADPSAQDDAAIEAAMADTAVAAQSTVEAWLQANDPSQLSTDYEGYECTDKLKCPYKGTCVNGSYSNHICWIDKCGSATCQGCPGAFKDWAGNLVFKSWCGYICKEPVAYGKVVAVGIQGVTSWGSVLPSGGPYCFDP
ncbi:MAG: hypothetical protein QM820_18665 [Minicystis sp.]